MTDKVVSPHFLGLRRRARPSGREKREKQDDDGARTHLVESALVRKLLAKHLARPRHLLVSALLCPLDILPHALVLRHRPPTLDRRAFIGVLRGQGAVARQAEELAVPPEGEGKGRVGVVGVVDVRDEVGRFLCR